MKRRILAALAAVLSISALTGTVPAAAIEPAFCFPKPMPSVTITNVDHVYETESAQLNVALSNGYCWTVKVDYRTVAGSASSPGDYVYKSGTLEFSPTEKCCSKSITININEDGPEPATEWFIVVLSNPVNATIATSAGGYVYIHDGSRPAG